MIGIAVCAVGLALPRLFLLGAALTFWWFLILGVLYSPGVRRAAGWLVVAVIIAILYALWQPGVVTRCRAGRPAPSSPAAMPLPAPAAVGARGEPPDRPGGRLRSIDRALFDGDPGRVLAGVEAACRDYRDPLFWAEHPEESSFGRVARAEMAECYRRLGVPGPLALR